MTLQKSETWIHELLAPIGIQINGKEPWDVQVHNPRFFDRILSDPDLGLGESYMDGWWDCEAIDEMINRALRGKVDRKVERDWKMILPYSARAMFLNLQSAAKAFEVGERHYDLGNDLYRAMLDKRLNYTCAYWKNAETLDEAQEAKLLIWFVKK